MSCPLRRFYPGRCRWLLRGLAGDWLPCLPLRLIECDHLLSRIDREPESRYRNAKGAGRSIVGTGDRRSVAGLHIPRE